MTSSCGLCPPALIENCSIQNFDVCAECDVNFSASEDGSLCLETDLGCAEDEESNVNGNCVVPQ